MVFFQDFFLLTPRKRFYCLGGEQNAYSVHFQSKRAPNLGGVRERFDEELES